MRPPAVRRRICLSAGLGVVAGCVGLQTPLQPDQSYPADWPRTSTLGPECKRIAGTYANNGILAVAGGQKQGITLLSVLNLSTPANNVTLNIFTRSMDRHGDSFSTLEVTSDLAGNGRFELADCYCIKETLACPMLSRSSWSAPYLGFGGSQKNLYLSVAQDKSLIAKLQNYRIDMISLVPLFSNSEPWARFEKFDRQ